MSWVRDSFAGAGRARRRGLPGDADDDPRGAPSGLTAVVGEGEQCPWLLDGIARAASKRRPIFPASESTANPRFGYARMKQLDPSGRSRPRSLRCATLLRSRRLSERPDQARCCFECVFCSYPLIEGSKVRMRSPQRRRRDRRFVAALRRSPRLLVDTSSTSRSRMRKRICTELETRNLSIECRLSDPKFVDEELVERMARRDAGSRSSHRLGRRRP